MGRISPGPTRWPPGAERRLVPAKSKLKPQTSPSAKVRCIAPDLTLHKCDAAPYFPLPQQLTLVFPGMELRGAASANKGTRPPLSKQQPISCFLPQSPFQRCNASVHFCADAEKTQTTITRPCSPVLALPGVLLPCGTAVPLSRHRGKLQMLRSLSSQGPPFFAGALLL